MGLLDWLGGNAPGNDPTHLSAAELVRRLKEREAGLIVDVREPEELSGSLAALPGAKNIPLSEFGRRYSEIPKDRRVTLVCRSGGRSAQAVAFLQRQGYTQLQNVHGGMLAVRALEGR